MVIPSKWGCNVLGKEGGNVSIKVIGLKGEKEATSLTSTFSSAAILGHILLFG